MGVESTTRTQDTYVSETLGNHCEVEMSVIPIYHKRTKGMVQAVERSFYVHLKDLTASGVSVHK